MDMLEVRKFEGPRPTFCSDVLRWLASEIRRPSGIRQIRSQYWNIFEPSGCALGKVWYQNRHRLRDPQDLDHELRRVLGLFAEDVRGQIITWNDAEALTFNEIADRLDAWALCIDENGGKYVKWRHVRGWIAYADVKGMLTVKVTEDEGALV